MQRGSISEDGRVRLHGLLHFEADIGRRVFAVWEAEFVEFGNGGLAGVLGDFRDGIAGTILLGDGVSAGASKDDEIEKRVGAQSVGAMDRCARSLTGGVQTFNNFILTVVVGDDLRAEVESVTIWK